MRPIRKIIIHCSATPEGRPDTMEAIKEWHTNKVTGNGWKDIGYHYVIELNGAVRAGRPLVTEGAHTSGHNSDSIGICYVGGMTKDMKKPKDTRTDAQKAALRTLVFDLLERFPDATVHGHREFANKACPSFDVHQEDWGSDGRMPMDEPADGGAIEKLIEEVSQLLRTRLK